MKELFFQPEDQRYAIQTEDGRYRKIEESITDDHIKAHLNGDVTLGDYTTYRNTCLFGATDIGEGSSIGPNTVLRDAKVGKECRIEQAVVENVAVDDGTVVEPFSHLRG